MIGPSRSACSMIHYVENPLFPHSHTPLFLSYAGDQIDGGLIVRFLGDHGFEVA